jgi:hypothetical protein
LVAGRQMIREVLPVRDISVRVALPPRQTVKSVSLEPEGQDLNFDVTDGYVSVTVPEVSLHSMVVVELE